MLKKIISGLVVLLFICSGFATDSKPTPESVKAITKKVADWQIATFEEQHLYRAISASIQKDIDQQNKGSDRGRIAYAKSFLKKWPDLAWHNAALYAGMNEWRKVADDEEAYTKWLLSIAERNDWKLGSLKYHADHHAVGQYYLALYEEFQTPEMIAHTVERFDWIMANRITGSLRWRRGHEADCHKRWGWCDALFMAPPVWARLAKVTGEHKYLEFMDEEYHATYDYLWDDDEQLFFRDSTYFKKPEKNGKKTFWSRGNGWVFSGLALMISDLPEDWEGRPFYIDVFRQMAETLKKTQRADGTWSMGLLGDLKEYPIPETSGTAFFTHGLAWGINNDILDRATYESTVLKAWAALTACVQDDGLLGHVQPVGAAPGESYPDKSEVYGVGAFLSAGSEVYKMVGGEAPASGKKSTKFTTFMKDGGWCWYQDPRAIVHDGKLFIGSVQGKGTGPALVGVYDLQENKPLGTVLMQDNFNRDDHNSPVFHVRPDGSVLSVYAKHNRAPFHYSRISDPADPLKWSDEFKHKRRSPNPKDKVTYMNLCEMKDEGLLYNFYRGINFNPTFVTSADHGKTWSDPVHFFQNEVGGRHRPYARYAGNGRDTVYVSITDAHPRNYGNSLYYFEFRDGKYFKADGTFIKALADGPLLPSEAERIYTGSMTTSKPKGYESVPNSAWTSSVAVDTDGHPHIGYTLYLNNTDHRYRIASWDGTKWIDREVAYAGQCLYTKESSYTGLVSLDPVDPDVVFISSDVDPTTGKDLGGLHEIYRAQVGPADDISTIKWDAVTKGSNVRNIRPVILRGDEHRIVLWNRGEFNTYVDYDLDTVGFVEEL